MKIALVWPFNKAKWIWSNYRDGVRAAMETIVLQNHIVDWYLDELPTQKYDAVVIWADSNDHTILKVKGLADVYALILTTELGLNIANLRNYDIVFCEAQPVYEKIRATGLRAVKAFGTDTRFFDPFVVPYQKNNLNWEAFYPATFSPWKRNNVFADKYREKGLLLGTVQPDGFDILVHCITRKANIMVGYYPSEFLRSLYLMSEIVDIAGYDGSGRTVLEALSMGLTVEAAPDNNKCQSYLQEWRDSGLDSRQFILKNYSEKIYASQILRGLCT